jgi:L-threonylcarbamoyladenylate synthase
MPALMHKMPPPVTKVLETFTPQLFRHAVAETVSVLRSGQVAAIPTETVYGLAADAFNPQAVRRIFQIKGRPAVNPLIVHVASMAMLRGCAGTVSESVHRLAELFWPGPLTVVLPRSEKISDDITGGGGTVAIRWPGHPFFRDVIRELGNPVAAPSANLSNRLSPTTVEHVLDQLNGLIPLVVDAGPCAVGIESTVLDLSGTVPAILRPGIISADALRSVLPGLSEGITSKDRTISRSPGMMPIHYAPIAPLRLFHFTSESDLVQLAGENDAAPGQTIIMTHLPRPLAAPWKDCIVFPFDPEAYARALYGELFRSDKARPRLILIESPPDGPEWAGVSDRIKRAAAPRS